VAKLARIVARRGLAQRYLVAAICLVMVALLAGFALLIGRNETAARRALADRYETRATLSASFAQSYVNDLAARERSQAERLLAGPDVSEQTFEDVVKSFDFEAGVLLDHDRNALQVWPPETNALNSDVSAEYTSMRTAAAGRGAVTVSSGSGGQRVTAVAVTFASDAGARVFSGAFSPAATLLGSFLNSGISGGGGTAYLVERSGDILAASTGADRTMAELAALRPGTSTLDAKTGSATAAVADVPSLPWRIVLVAPNAALYSPVTGGHWAPWALWWALAGSELLALVLFVRLGRARASAASTARTDALTGLPNRRAMQELLNRAGAVSARHGTPLAALMIDIDRFKAINDAYGHDVGDLVIQATATALTDATRDADVAGRWGGEEFLILLHHADSDSVRVVAERVRMSIATATIPGRLDIDGVTASIGLAELCNGDTALMLREADAALYVAKANGRNRVEVAAVSAATRALRTGAAGIGAREAHL
jgi:diguanylate cyclase (GGDEF)-like protein